jgi:hypothetical protein
VRNAGLHGGIKIARTDPQDPFHPRHVDTHPAPQGYDIAFQAAATAKGDDWDLVTRADFDDRADLLSRLREGNGVRRHAGMIRGIPAMLLAHQFVGRQAIAQELRQ